MTQKLQVVVMPSPEPLATAILARLGPAHPEVEGTVAANEQELLDLVSRADAALVWEKSPEIVALLPRLRWVQSLSVSPEHVPYDHFGGVDYTGWCVDR